MEDRLAAIRKLEKLIEEVGESPEIDPAFVQRILEFGVQQYYKIRSEGTVIGPFVDEERVSATAGMVAAANILDAVDVDVFELGMFKGLAGG